MIRMIVWTTFIAVTFVPVLEAADLVQTEFIFTEASFEQCHASTIVELRNGDLMAAWFGGLEEGDESVAIWGSVRSNGKWSSPFELAREPNMPCWNPVLFLDAGSKLWLFYKVGPSPREWSGVYKTSEDGGKTWSPQTILPAGLLGPIKNKPVMLSNGDIICGTSIESYKAWTCWVEISSDTGRTWQKYGPIFVPDENHGIIQPTIWETAEGHVKMLVRSTHRIGFVCQAVSRDMGRTWGPATRTNLPHPGSGLDAVKLRTGQVALVYNHTKQGRSPLNVAFSRDDGRSWDAPIVLENEPGEYSYPAIIQGTDGNLHITYTWKRQRIKYAMVKP